MYVNFNENPRGNYYAGDCVVRAINIVTGISWDEIYTALCVEGFYLGDWGNTNASWDWYLRSLGFKRYICPNDCPFCYSLIDFANDHPVGKYIVATIWVVDITTTMICLWKAEMVVLTLVVVVAHMQDEAHMLVATAEMTQKRTLSTR